MADNKPGLGKFSAGLNTEYNNWIETGDLNMFCTKMIPHLRGMSRVMVKKRCPMRYSTAFCDDIFSELLRCLYDCTRTYNPDNTTTFSTYFFIRAQFSIVEYLRVFLAPRGKTPMITFGTVTAREEKEDSESGRHHVTTLWDDLLVEDKRRHIVKGANGVIDHTPDYEEDYKETVLVAVRVVLDCYNKSDKEVYKRYAYWFRRHYLENENVKALAEAANVTPGCILYGMKRVAAAIKEEFYRVKIEQSTNNTE